MCKHLVKFFEKRAQNLNTAQNNSASWDLQMGFNSAFKGLKTPEGLRRVVGGEQFLFNKRLEGKGSLSLIT